MCEGLGLTLIHQKKERKKRKKEREGEEERKEGRRKCIGEGIFFCLPLIALPLSYYIFPGYYDKEFLSLFL
jgi:hypothetical protein